MTPDTVTQLLQLNEQFYARYAESFHHSRQKAWEGWEQLLPLIQSQLQAHPAVLDLGCGNGRFGLFLAQHVRTLEYFGVDSSKELLAHAQSNLANALPESYQLQQLNLVTELIQGTLLSNLQKLSSTPQVLSLFGVMHHIPSRVLRKQLLTTCLEILPRGGLLLVSFWQPANHKRFAAKALDPSLFGIRPDSLEPGDLLLGWQGKLEYPRYIHHTSDQEIQDLLDTLTPHTLVKTFLADGKTHNLNRYICFRKT